jgi:hypothetical protein
LGFLNQLLKTKEFGFVLVEILKDLLNETAELLTCIDSCVRRLVDDIIVRQHLMFMAVAIIDNRNSPGVINYNRLGDNFNYVSEQAAIRPLRDQPTFRQVRNKDAYQLIQRFSLGQTHESHQIHR